MIGLILTALVNVALVPAAQTATVDEPFAVDIVLTCSEPQVFAGFQTEFLTELALVDCEPVDYEWWNDALVDGTKLALFGDPASLPVAPLTAERLWFTASAHGVYSIGLGPELTIVGVPNPGHPGIDATGTLTGCVVTVTPEPTAAVLMILCGVLLRRR